VKLWGTLEKLKNIGVTGDSVVYSFLVRRVQPLQHWIHPGFRYEGLDDPSRFSSEKINQFELLKRCCKVLDGFDMSPKFPKLFCAANPLENTWVSSRCHIRVLSICTFVYFLMYSFLQVNYKV
jgi:hypothetical protein